MMAKMIIIMDPPEHRQMRSLVNKVFTPRAIEAMRPMVTETIDRYISTSRVPTGSTSCRTSRRCSRSK